MVSCLFALVFDGNSICSVNLDLKKIPEISNLKFCFCSILGSSFYWSTFEALVSRIWVAMAQLEIPWIKRILLKWLHILKIRLFINLSWYLGVFGISVVVTTVVVGSVVVVVSLQRNSQRACRLSPSNVFLAITLRPGNISFMLNRGHKKLGPHLQYQMHSQAW